MKKHLTYFVLTFAIMLGLTFSQAQAAVVIIDDFATGVDLSSFGTSSAVDDGFYSNVLGGYRDTRVFASSGGVSINYSPVVGNTIAFNALAGSSGYYVSHYNGIGTNGSLNLDLLGSNTTGNFTLIVNAANGTGTAHVSVVDNNDNHFSSIQDITNGFAGSLNFNYSDFLGAGVDLTNIKSVNLGIFSSSVADDFTLGLFTATSSVVPEPASLALLGVGGLMLLRRRNRTRVA